MKDPEILNTYPYNQIIKHFEDIQIDIPAMIDNGIFQCIQVNNLDSNSNEIRQRLFDFSKKLTIIQHFCFYSKIVGLCKIMSKLLTRIWWIYHTSSPIMIPFRTFEENKDNKDEKKKEQENIYDDVEEEDAEEDQEDDDVEEEDLEEDQENDNVEEDLEEEDKEVKEI